MLQNNVIAAINAIEMVSIISIRQISLELFPSHKSQVTITVVNEYLLLSGLCL